MIEGISNGNFMLFYGGWLGACRGGKRAGERVFRANPPLGSNNQKISAPLGRCFIPG